MKRVISLILALTLALASAVPAAADDATGTTLRLDETTGTVGVTDAAGVDKTIRAGMRLYNGYGVETGASSAAYITLDDTKAVKLDASGKAEIKKQGKKLEVALTSGQLYFNVTEPLKTDESLNIRTATMVTGIRGSFGWVSPDHMGLLHGHVTLTCTNPETGETRVTEVYSGELVRYEQNAQETAADAELLAIDFVKTEVTLAAIPAVVVEQVANDETLQAQLIEDVPALDVTELIESLPTKQAEEKAAEAAAQTQVEAAVAVQEQTIAAAAAADAVAQEKDDGAGQAYANLSGNTPTTVSDDDDSDSDDNDSDSTPAPTAITLNEAAQLSDALGSYDSVTFTGTGTADSLTIPSGKTLTVAEGADLTLSGTTSNLSSNTVINNGTITLTGGFENGDSNGTAGRFVNNGELKISGGAFYNHYKSVFEGTRPDSGFYQKHLIMFHTNGGSAVDAAEYVSGLKLTELVPPASPTKADYTFAGWYKDAALTSPVVETDILSADTTLYAKWMSNYTVTIPTGAGPDGATYGYSVSLGDATIPYLSSSSADSFTLAIPNDGTTHMVEFSVTHSSGSTIFGPEAVKAGGKALEADLSGSQENYSFSVTGNTAVTIDSTDIYTVMDAASLSSDTLTGKVAVTSTGDAVSVTIDSGATLFVASKVTLSCSSAINNAGTILVQRGGVLNVRYTSVNTGTITSNGVLNLNAPLNNGGQLTNIGSDANINLPSGVTLNNYYSDGAMATGGVISGSGAWSGGGVIENALPGSTGGPTATGTIDADAAVAIAAAGITVNP